MYKVYKYFRKEGKRPQLVEKGLTLEEAKRLCNNPNTRKEGVWFYGFTKY